MEWYTTSAPLFGVSPLQPEHLSHRIHSQNWICAVGQRMHLASMVAQGSEVAHACVRLSRRTTVGDLVKLHQTVVARPFRNRVIQPLSQVILAVVTDIIRR